MSRVFEFQYDGQIENGQCPSNWHDFILYTYGRLSAIDYNTLPDIQPKLNDTIMIYNYTGYSITQVGSVGRIIAINTNLTYMHVVKFNYLRMPPIPTQNSIYEITDVAFVILKPTNISLLPKLSAISNEKLYMYSSVYNQLMASYNEYINTKSKISFNYICGMDNNGVISIAIPLSDSGGCEQHALIDKKEMLYKSLIIYKNNYKPVGLARINRFPWRDMYDKHLNELYIMSGGKKTYIISILPTEIGVMYTENGTNHLVDLVVINDNTNKQNIINNFVFDDSDTDERNRLAVEELNKLQPPIPVPTTIPMTSPIFYRPIHDTGVLPGLPPR